METYYLAIIVFFSSFVQTSLGFGFSLVALPFLIIFKVPLPSIIFFLTACSFLQTLSVTYFRRFETPWRWVIKAILIRLLSIPLGVMFLKVLNTLNLPDLTRLLGVVLLIIIGLRWYFKQKNKSNKPISDLWGYVAFILSGFMAGAIGVGGPPLAIWCMNQNWNANQVRGFLATLFSLTIPYMLFLLHLEFPENSEQALSSVLIALPFLILGLILGLKMNKHIPHRIFQKAVYTLIVLMCIKMIFFP